MKFNIPERLTLVNSLPEKGTFATLKMIEEVKSSLYPSEAETKKFEIKQVANNISWNKEGTNQIEIKITDGQKKLIIESLEGLDKKGEATIPHFHLHNRFTELDVKPKK